MSFGSLRAEGVCFGVPLLFILAGEVMSSPFQDIQADIRALQPGVPLSSDTVSVSESTTLAALLTAASSSINTNLKRLLLQPASGASIYMSVGKTATAESFLIPSTGLNLLCDPTTAATLQFYAASSLNLGVIQTG